MAGVAAAVKTMVIDRKPISPDQASEAMKDLLSGASAGAQTAAFLAALQARELDPSIVAACADSMRSFAAPCVVPNPEGVMDIVGTGGDGLDTFNVSTAAALVMAAAGIQTAKHGNRSASGNVGSADFLEALGCSVQLDGPAVAKCVEQTGFGFLFAQMFHPAMKNVAAARKEMGVPTIFNVLGPLTNPVNPGLQVIGVGKKSLGQTYADMFQAKGVKRAMIVHSQEGLDEISPSGPTHVWLLQDGKVTESSLSPSDFGVEAHALALCQGGSVGERASLLREIFAGGKKRKGETAAHAAVKDYIIINAAAAIFLARKADSYKAAADIARSVIEDGRALALLDAYAALSSSLGAALGDAPRVGGEKKAPVPPRFSTEGGIAVVRVEKQVDGGAAIEKLVDALDEHKGLLMMSTFEYPGRYTRWKVGFVDPPVQVVSRDLSAIITALNDRGVVLVAALAAWLGKSAAVNVSGDTRELKVEVKKSADKFLEEERSRQPSVFSLVRLIISCFSSKADPDMGLYGAFGYDLTFQFEPCRLKLDRPDTQRDLVLFIPDQLLLVGYDDTVARQVTYDFTFEGKSTAGLPRTGSATPFVGSKPSAARDHQPGEYAKLVLKAKEEFKCGNLFEVVCSQTFYEPCPAPPSELHRRIRERNPSPYSFLINLGDSEYLIGASPEMYVRSEGRRVETCPISGTIQRGATAIEDAANVKELLNSAKEESELTMCTDVDRNDKSRICVPGSVKVLGRRQIEMYSRLIHTVDHVEGQLREDKDALDAFLAHTWAVTVTGAPKAWAMQFLEDNERTCRHWYGGAIGHLGFDGNINTGLTLRTIRVRDGVAQVRAGATLLFDSDPDAEEAETLLKASAFLDALRRPRGEEGPGKGVGTNVVVSAGRGKRVLLIDHQDSFVHNLANYIRQTGAEVVTIRSQPGKVGLDPADIDRLQKAGGAFSLAVLSPGPGNPTDFQVPASIKMLEERKIPIFGVCLGLQGMVERYGGKLGMLPVPVHGKPSEVYIKGDQTEGIFSDMPADVICGRYHSLYCVDLPDSLTATAVTQDGCIMAIRHKTLPVAAVQFHPESILTTTGMGVQILANALKYLHY